MFEYKCNIVRVVDGDTVDVDIDLGFGIWVRNERVRLYGIDTPESRTRDLREKFYGKYATEYLIAKLGDSCILRTKKDRAGKFGRVLGEFVVYDGHSDSWKSVNEMMVRDFIAVPYHGQSKDEIAQMHLENYAALSQIGIAYSE
jgi:micrococcal nuclease